MCAIATWHWTLNHRFPIEIGRWHNIDKIWKNLQRMTYSIRDGPIEQIQMLSNKHFINSNDPSCTWSQKLRAKKTTFISMELVNKHDTLHFKTHVFSTRYLEWAMGKRMTSYKKGWRKFAVTSHWSKGA